MSPEFSFAVFDRPLSQSFRYGDRELQNRRGVLLRLQQGNQFFCSEASPLPGHSPDTLEDVMQALHHLGSTELTRQLSQAAPDLPAALRFALEGLSALIARPKFFPVRSNALLTETKSGRWHEEVSWLVERGYSHFKLKVRPDNVASIPDQVAALRDQRVRLDANRSLQAGQLADLFRALSDRNLLRQIDYLEEPLANWDHPLLRDSPLPLAADESAGSPSQIMEMVAGRFCPNVFILKPTVLGGLRSLSPLVRQLASLGRRAVFTTALESEAGRRAIFAFLGSEPSQEVHGLSTGFLFRDNFLPDAAEISCLPATAPAEEAFLRQLDWRACP